MTYHETPLAYLVILTEREARKAHQVVARVQFAARVAVEVQCAHILEARPVRHGLELTRRVCVDRRFGPWYPAIGAVSVGEEASAVRVGLTRRFTVAWQGHLLARVDMGV